MARRFGLGSRIDVGLENEKAGLIPDKEWKLRRFGEPWQQGESVISGIGQGYILTTPLQLATMVARIANGGYEVKPTFTKVKDKSTIRKLMLPMKISSWLKTACLPWSIFRAVRLTGRILTITGR